MSIPSNDHAKAVFKPAVQAISATVLIFALLSAFDMLVLGFNPIRKTAIILDGYYLFRLVLCLSLAWWITNTARWNSYTPQPADTMRITARLGWMSTLMALGLLVMFLLSPALLTTLGKEDSLVEWASFALLFSAALLFLRTGLTVSNKTERLLLLLLSATLCFIALEEVSWFQRVLGFGSPEFFRNTAHGETNLHNLSTREFEVIYYTGTAIFLCLIPFVLACAPQLRSAPVYRFLPGRRVALTVLVMNTMLWQMFNTIVIQVTAWAALFALVQLARHDSGLRRVSIAMLMVMVVALVLYLILGENFVRDHDLTEYREFFIALGFCVHGLEAFGKRNKQV